MRCGFIRRNKQKKGQTYREVVAESRGSWDPGKPDCRVWSSLWLRGRSGFFVLGACIRVAKGWER